MRNYKRAALAVVGLSAVLLGGNAAAVTLTTLTGTNVSYTFDSTATGLFGSASVVGDNLVFAPTAFMATSTNGLPGFASQTLHVTVTANSGYELSSFSLSESGSYTRSSNNAVVGVTGSITALDIEGNTSLQLIGSVAANVPLSNATGVSTPWTAGSSITLPATGWGGADGVVSSIKLTLSNQLYATSLPFSSGSILKNNVGINTVATPVPEAETYAMMLAGLGLVGFMARRGARMVV